jgi:hypothetical protein
MKKTLRLQLLVVVLISVASAVALQAAARPLGDGNRLEASFSEAPASITNRIADLQIFQLITTGNGTVEGFGAASMVVGVTQDRAVTPCGPGSWTNAATRRITLEGGVLVLRELAYACPTPSGIVISGTYEVDGLSSRGIFAGARGHGEAIRSLAGGPTTLSGKLHLDRSSD